MAIIYLQHPVHGTKVATMEAEAAYDEGRGWKRFDPHAAPAPLPDPEVNVLAAVVAADPEPEPETERHPLDHDGDGKPGGSLPGPRRRRRAPEE